MIQSPDSVDVLLLAQTCTPPPHQLVATEPPILQPRPISIMQQECNALSDHSLAQNFTSPANHQLPSCKQDLARAQNCDDWPRKKQQCNNRRASFLNLARNSALPKAALLAGLRLH